MTRAIKTHMTDFVAIVVYVIASVVFWYVGLVPDMATLRDRATRRWQRVLYGILALGWQGSSRHWHEYRSVYLILAALMAGEERFVSHSLKTRVRDNER